MIFMLLSEDRRLLSISLLPTNCICESFYSRVNSTNERVNKSSLSNPLTQDLTFGRILPLTSVIPLFVSIYNSIYDSISTLKKKNFPIFSEFFWPLVTVIFGHRQFAHRHAFFLSGDTLMQL